MLWNLWKNNSWLLHHDNAPAHTSLLVREFLTKNNTVRTPQLPYSSDMATCDFFLFPKIERTLKGRRLTVIDDIKSVSLKELKVIRKIEFEKCFEDWKKRWHNCIISNGDYSEGDNINVDEWVSIFFKNRKFPLFSERTSYKFIIRNQNVHKRPFASIFIHSNVNSFVQSLKSCS